MMKKTLIAFAALFLPLFAADAQQYQKQREQQVKENVPLSTFREAQKIL